MIFVVILIALGVYLIILGLIVIIWRSFGLIEFGSVLGLLFLLLGAGTLGVSFKLYNKENAGKPQKTHEYPASEYVLEYKVTEYQGQKDTTYVLIEREK